MTSPNKSEETVNKNNYLPILKERLKHTATRKGQRERQRVIDPLKYEQLKSKNQISTAKYNQLKRDQRKLMSEKDLLADRKKKADARKRQRDNKKKLFFGMEN